MELLVALDLLLIGLSFWTLALRRWEAAAGALVALLGSLPLLFLALGGAFRWSAALLCAATLLGGGLVLVRGLGRDGRG